MVIHARAWESPLYAEMTPLAVRDTYSGMHPPADTYTYSRMHTRVSAAAPPLPLPRDQSLKVVREETFLEG